MKKEFLRKVIVYENHFKEFRKTLDRETLKKLYQVLTLIMVVKMIPVKYLKSIEGRKGLFEIRVEQGNNIYRRPLKKTSFCILHENSIYETHLDGFRDDVKS